MNHSGTSRTDFRAPSCRQHSRSGNITLGHSRLHVDLTDNRPQIVASQKDFGSQLSNQAKLIAWDRTGLPNLGNFHPPARAQAGHQHDMSSLSTAYCYIGASAS